MTANGFLQIGLVTLLVLATVRPLGGYLHRVLEGEPTVLRPVLGPLERLLYRLAGVRPDEDQHWTAYARSLLVFNLLGVVALYALMRFQHLLPLNPAGQAAVGPDLAFNTAVSFVTNTNWQSYAGEQTMSHLTQMAGLAVQNFLSAATGIAISVALVRGFARHEARGIGNFWADVVRLTLYVLLPLCLVGALVLVWQGVPQNFAAPVTATTLAGATQTIPQGPVASQEIIKQLGTNGGGFFNANSAHPYENPTPLANLLAMWSIFALGAALTNTFGRMVRNERQGWALLAAMGLLFAVGVGVCWQAESGTTPLFARLGIDTAPSALQAGGNMEGKEVRFGIANTALFATMTTDASCGAVNGMHASFTPIGGLVPLVNMMLGEVIVGGVGAGLYGMLLFAILAVFIAGLMVGRTPEYLGKKIQAKEVQMTMVAMLALNAAILIGAAIAVVVPQGTGAVLNGGPRGFTEMLYAFTSAGANNGSAFAGLSANAPFWNVGLGLAMLAGRFMIIVPALAIAGTLVGKKVVAPSAGTFPTTGPLFVGLLVGCVLVVGGLTFFPALSLGPIVEQLMLLGGRTL